MRRSCTVFLLQTFFVGLLLFLVVPSAAKADVAKEKYQEGLELLQKNAGCGPQQRRNSK